jgi:CubicO group peptidase (beta-lactamase class C family)
MIHDLPPEFHVCADPRCARCLATGQLQQAPSRQASPRGWREGRPVRLEELRRRNTAALRLHRFQRWARQGRLGAGAELPGRLRETAPGHEEVPEPTGRSSPDWLPSYEQMQDWRWSRASAVLEEARLPPELPSAWDRSLVERHVLVNVDGAYHHFVLVEPDAVVGELDRLDAPLLDYMARHRIPNGAAAVVAGDGRLVYCTAFTNLSLITTPTSMIRLASVSKALTAVGVMRAVELGLLSLTDPFRSYANRVLDPIIPLTVTVPYALDTERDLHLVQVADLLWHGAGWKERDVIRVPDLDTMGEHGRVDTPRDPPELESEPRDGRVWAMEMTHSHAFIAKKLGVDVPLSLDQMVEFAFSPQGFAFYNRDYWTDPVSALAAAGASYTAQASVRSYSNLGFAMLAPVIEGATGIPYESWMKTEVFWPLGMYKTLPGANREEDLYAEEMHYVFDKSPNDVFAPEATSTKGEMGGRPYGVSDDLGPSISSGGWVSSVLDLARLLQELRPNNRAPVVLNHANNLTMRDSYPGGSSPNGYGVTLGWSIDWGASTAGTWTTGGTTRTVWPIWKDGLLSGSHSYLYQNSDLDRALSGDVVGTFGFALLFNRDNRSYEEDQIMNTIRSLLFGRVVYTTAGSGGGYAGVRDWGDPIAILGDHWKVFEP